MALDYSMMRDSVGMDVMNRLSRAQGIGESAGALGFLGANAINEQGGLMQMFNNAKYKMNKPKYDAMYQQGLKDNPYLQGDETDNFWNEVDAMSTSKDGTNVTGGRALIDSLNNKKTVTNMKYDAGVRDMVPVTETVTTPIQGTPIPEAMDEIYAPKQVISSEPTGAAAGGSIGSVNPDGSFEYIYPDGRIEMLQPGQQPGANTPINTAITNENISDSYLPSFSNIS